MKKAGSLKARLRASKTHRAPVMKLLGMRIAREGSGSAVLTMKVRKTYLNTVGVLHGGILCDLSDAAMGCAFTTLLARDQVGVTVEFKINFLKLAFVSDELTATGKVLSHGRVLYYAECEVRNKSGLLVAKAAATLKAF